MERFQKSMVEQVDDWVGKLLDELDNQGVVNETLVIFTADHGEMLGSFGMQGKIGLYEPALHVPLLMRFPPKITPGTVVTRPVGHIHLFATIMDYLGYADWDDSDGKSLRSAISNKSYREKYEDEFAVGETEGEQSSGTEPGYMVRYGPWKLFIAEQSDADIDDILINLESDPYEVNNLLKRKRLQSLTMVGIVEHLKCLLLEWMVRNNGGSQKYFSDRERNPAIQHIRERRSWEAVDQWQSHADLEIKEPVFVDDKWRSNVWLYIGRTAPGSLQILNVTFEGTGIEYFSVNQNTATLGRDEYTNIRVSFVSDTYVDPKTLDVQLVVESNVYNRRVVNLR